jgi:hypothetical protein
LFVCLWLEVGRGGLFWGGERAERDGARASERAARPSAAARRGASFARRSGFDRRAGDRNEVERWAADDSAPPKKWRPRERARAREREPRPKLQPEGKRGKREREREAKSETPRSLISSSLSLDARRPADEAIDGQGHPVRVPAPPDRAPAAERLLRRRSGSSLSLSPLSSLFSLSPPPPIEAPSTPQTRRGTR